MSIWEYANPKKFTETFSPVVPWAYGLAAVLLAVGLIWGFFFTPEAVNFGSTVKIIYVHVPTSFVAINAWAMMLITSLVWLIRRHHVSALAAKAAAPVGMAMTFLGLITGAIWGQPMWGCWWEWDPRLTAFLILFLFYFGYIALWQAISDPDVAADLTSVLCIVGSVFAFISRYAINFWSQSLHQGASLSMDAQENVSDVYWIPLVICLAGVAVLFIALVLQRTITEIRIRRISALSARAARLQGEA